MTEQNKHLESVQERIAALHETIAEREQDIRDRARKFQSELEQEISPAEIVRRHPWQAVLGALAAGLLTGRMLRSLASGPADGASAEPAVHAALAPIALPDSAMRDIRLELIRSAKDLGVNYLQRYIEGKFRKTPETPSSSH
ncbi:hypothetical protein [Pelodictyon luteolum]|uniref:DUF3618 domain-containing protein n=1 Tax=Chlorobium luteolum (strain DSM 273 / BCRC 81028 / 2530) TaxID=319225 RepID=Q3B261_CHLL3|nr:hypothetical protein [Pelodictyon luteolum]ABB24570.1 conserved hypothetical protein [Pelodictyon luteolum DSM 273]